MNNNTTIIIQMEVQRYEQDIQRWAAQVRAIRQLVPAMQAARHEPVPGSLIRSMSVLTSRARNQARREVDRALLEKLNADEHSLQALRTIEQLCRGSSFSNFQRALRDKLRQAQAAEKAKEAQASS